MDLGIFAQWIGLGLLVAASLGTAIAYILGWQSRSVSTLKDFSEAHNLLNESFGRRIDDLEKEILTGKEQYEKLEVELDFARQELKRGQAELSQLNSRVQTLEIENRGLKSRVQVLEKENKELKAENLRLKNKLE